MLRRARSTVFAHEHERGTHGVSDVTSCHILNTVDQSVDEFLPSDFLHCVVNVFVEVSDRRSVFDGLALVLLHDAVHKSSNAAQSD